ncbi:barstar family protein [Micromonospora marina]|uniref:Barstar (Barnase inhibitor) n=1 Tax=Micromonospora marina TaxID=307120 RepID=A0A1C4VP05_9ACTN|nr:MULTISPECIES: barstar family protein [Micromonospora]SCE85717.1 Barstar (barnase inhibitor) [Micromonospora marina]
MGTRLPAWLVYDGAPPEPDATASAAGPDGDAVAGGGASPGGVLVSGAAGRTRAALHETLAGALELPGWYGRNWDALADAFADRLDAGPLTVVVTDAADLLADDPPAQLGTLLDVLGAVAAGAHETLRVVLHDHPDRLPALRARVAAVLGGRVGAPPPATG